MTMSLKIFFSNVHGLMILTNSLLGFFLSYFLHSCKVNMVCLKEVKIQS